jgi:AcrR family transcriptional regulator
MTMSKNKDAMIRKQEILQAALTLFISKGYEKTSTNDILEALKLSRGGLYHHFVSKEDILDNAIAMILQSEITEAEAIINDEKLTAEDKLKYLIEYNPSMLPMVDEVRTIIQSKDNPTLITHLLRKKLELVTPLFIKIIEQGIAEEIFHCEYPEEVSKISIILSTLLFTDTIVVLSQEEFVRMIIVFQTAVETIVGAKKGTFDFMRESIIIGN